jgi:two-component system, NarL family, sensor kinase
MAILPSTLNLVQRMKSISGILFFVVSLSAAQAQAINYDSLAKVLQQMPNDSLKIVQYRTAAMGAEMTNPDFARLCYNQSIALGQQLKNSSETLQSTLQLAGFYINTNKYDSALIIGQKALNEAQANKNNLMEAKAYHIMGNAYRRLSQYPQAIDHYLKAVTIFEQLKEHKRTALTYSGIAAVFVETSESEKGVQYGEKGIQFAQLSKDPEALAKCYFNTGAAYGVNNEEKYIEYYKTGMPFALQTGNAVTIQQGYYNIANGYYQMGLEEKRLYPEAVAYADSSYQWAQKTGNPLNIFYASNIAAQIATLNKQYAKADELLTITAEALQSVSNNFTQRIYYSSLAKLRYEQGRFKEAYDYRYKQDEFKDSILNQEKLEAQAELEAKFATAKKEAEISVQKAELRHKTLLNFLLGGGVLAASIIALLGFRNYRHQRQQQQQRIKELEAEKQLAATEAVLKGEEQERSRLAKDLHDGLGGMLSGTKYAFNTMKGNLILTSENAQAFERSMDMLDSSIKEMRRVAHNMMPEALLKFGLEAAIGDFCNDINQSGALQVNFETIGLQGLQLEQTTGIAIYRIVQELLNNTMKHARARSAIVQLAKHDQQLTITVEDDGKGFDKAILVQEAGMGWKNIRNRVQFINGHIEVDSTIGKGTSVTIEITL